MSRNQRKELLRKELDRFWGLVLLQRKLNSEVDPTKQRTAGVVRVKWHQCRCSNRSFNEIHFSDLIRLGPSSDVERELRPVKAQIFCEHLLHECLCSCLLKMQLLRTICTDHSVPLSLRDIDVRNFLHQHAIVLFHVLFRLEAVKKIEYHCC